MEILLSEMVSTSEELWCIKGLRIARLNIYCRFPKFKMIKDHLMACTIDVLLLAETWLKEAFPTKLIEIKGYNRTIRFDRSGRNV